MVPFGQQLAETLDGRRVLVLLPDEHKGHCLRGGEGNEPEQGAARANQFGHDADPGARLDVGHHGSDHAWGLGEAGEDAGAAAPGDDGVVEAHAFAAGEDDEGLAGQLFPWHAAPRGEGMAHWDDDAERLGPEEGGLKAAGFKADDGAGDGGGEAALGDHFPDALGSALLEVNGDEGITPLVFGKEAPEEWGGGRADVAEAKFALLAGGGAADAADGFVPLLEEEGGFVEKDRAGRGEADVVAAALEDFGAEGGLELLDGAAEGGLGDAEAAGRAGETEILRDGAEILQVPEFHGDGDITMA